MNEDPVPFLRDLLSRRELSPAEMRQLQDWLREHPESAALWPADVQLSRALRGLPETPVPSNFTARVLAEVALSSRRPLPPSPVEFDWRAWLQRYWVPAGSTAVLVLATALALQARSARRDAEFARQIAPLRVLAEISPTVLEDFDAIRRFAERPAPVDLELLAALQP